MRPCAGRRRRSKDIVRHAIIIGNPPTPDLGPDIIAAARDDNGELFLWKVGAGPELVLGSAELVERAQHFRWQQLADDAVDRVEGEPAGGQIHLPTGRDDIRLFARVQHEGLAVDLHDRLKQ